MSALYIECLTRSKASILCKRERRHRQLFCNTVCVARVPPRRRETFNPSTMMFRTLMLCGCIAMVAVMAEDRAPIDKDTRKAVSVFNVFGEKVYRELSRREGNIFLSPISVSAIVGMIHLGARGKTAEEMEDVLGLQKFALNGSTLHEAVRKLITTLLPLVDQFDLQIANGVFVTDGLQVNVQYRDGLSRFYKAGLYSAPLKDQPEEAVSDLNHWVKDQTNGKIPVLLERPLPATIPLVMLNAVYFRGNWLHPFRNESTKRNKFYGSSRVNDNVELMYQEGAFIHIDTPQYQAVELPYKGEDIVMIVILPKDSKDLYRLEQTISYKDIRDQLSSVIKQRVKLTLPKFSLNLGYDMRGPLQDVGLNSMFSPRHANLTGISRFPVIALDTIYHKAIVDVNEEGTIALATTTGINRHSSLMNPQVAEFKADRPFLFIIEDVESNAVLFVGRVSDL
ncbi:leukocyte elastase inhibitor-like [Galendromus occidentalis]|uniref:Leukocyte elastase inhibitor-like n=1 Tax=Galendromus occidentalis TaxID=34638 RepID=A0AAJ7WGM9_9ACAR|nr:leukocyte elastase inhibitor-like [Galendromus occidentalis]